MQPDTTRTYPRTLAQAFRGPDYAAAIERPARAPYPRLLWVTLAAGFAVALWAAVST